MAYGQPRNASGGPAPYPPGYPNNNYAHPQAPPPLRQVQPSQISRAEAFDDEKKRIIASCFSKKDEKGTLLQSYITHIRVEEDGAYPSDPPPRNADPVHKKNRVIIAAVKMSGRVFLHKARENDDRTFQIGKTWAMEELQSVESFSAGMQRSARDQERVRDAGDSGFALTIMKPYFWKAKTPKEKAFFIGSLVKIYRKYTNGKLPKLIGFDPREERDIIAASEPSQRPPPPQSPGHPPAPGPPPPMPYTQRPSGSNTSLHSQETAPRRHRPSDVSADSSGRSPSAASSGRQRPPSPNRHRDEVPPLQPAHYASASPAPVGRSITPKLRSQTSQESHLRSRPSQEQTNPMRMETPDGSYRINHQQSRSNFSSPAPPEDRFDHRMPSSRYGSEAPDIMKDAPKSPNLMASPHDSYTISSATTDRWRVPGANSRATSAATTERHHTPNESVASNLTGLSHPSFVSDRSASGLQNQSLPERRRPPLENNAFSSQRPQDPIDEEDIPKPLRTPKPKQEPPSRPKPEETPSQLDARMPGSFQSPSPSRSRTPPPPLQTDLSSPKSSTFGQGLPNGQAQKPEDSKVAPLSRKPEDPKPSGLARKSEDSKPAISTRKSEDSKPVQDVQDAPTDAIVRSETPEPKQTTSKPTSPEPTKPGLGPMVSKKFGERSNAMANWGKVRTAATVAKAFTPRAGGAASRLRAQKEQPSNEPDGVTSVVPAPSKRTPAVENISEKLAQDQSKREEAPDVQITSASPSHDHAMVDGLDGIPNNAPEVAPVVQKPETRFQPQYDLALNALGIDGAALGGQGREFEATLTEFGWGQNILISKNVDVVESGLRKEIARLEAGPWLGHDSEEGEQKDAGVASFEKALDKAIVECDEMEKLLSLYSVELGVSHSI